jgi:uncharacterized protein YdeI (YjbR/CyaY-like superfamily)
MQVDHVTIVSQHTAALPVVIPWVAAVERSPTSTLTSRPAWLASQEQVHGHGASLHIRLSPVGSRGRKAADGRTERLAVERGWIDGRSKRIDDDWFVQRFTPRRPQSTWSKVNRQKIEALIAAGRMRPAGLAEIERAKADGRWEAAYDGMATSAVPEDLAAALEAAGLTDAFAELSRQNRYAILHRVQTAKKAETRERRIAKYVGMLAAGETPY